MPAPTKDEVAKYVDLVQQRRDSDRQSRLIKSQLETLEAKIFVHVNAKSGPKKSMKLFDWVFSILTRTMPVAWKDAYVDHAGADAANELKAATTKKEYLHFEELA